MQDTTLGIVEDIFKKISKVFFNVEISKNQG